MSQPVALQRPTVDFESLLPGSMFFDGNGLSWLRDRHFLSDAFHKGGSVLDVGCGNGLLLRCLETWAGFDLLPFGIDNREDSIFQARKLFPGYEDNFRLFDLYRLRSELPTGFPRQYDFVFFCLFDNWNLDRKIERDLLRRFMYLTKSGGRLIVALYGPDEETIQRRMSTVAEILGPPVATGSNAEGSCRAIWFGQEDILGKTAIERWTNPKTISPLLHSYCGASEFGEISRRVSRYTRNTTHIEQMCRVISGLRPGATILTRRRQDLLKLIGAAVDFDLHFRVIEKPGIWKFIFGQGSEIVEVLRSLEKQVFGAGVASQEAVEQYGSALGYPACCITSFSKGLNKLEMRNPVGWYLSRTTWPILLSPFALWIDHFSCDPGCERSLFLGQRAVGIRAAVYELAGLKLDACCEYVLHFNQNLWARLRINISGKVQIVRKVIGQSLNPGLEDPRARDTYDTQLRFLQEIKAGLRIRVTPHEVSLERKDGRLEGHHTKGDCSDGCLIAFTE